MIPQHPPPACSIVLSQMESEMSFCSSACFASPLSPGVARKGNPLLSKHSTDIPEINY